jgi:hypothetical protein
MILYEGEGFFQNITGGIVFLGIFYPYPLISLEKYIKKRFCLISTTSFFSIPSYNLSILLSE